MNVIEAYVLVQTESSTRPIANDLRAVPGVIVAEELSGPYAAIARARSDLSGRPLEGIIAEIREVPGVIRTIFAPLRRSSTGLRDDEAA